MNQKNPKCYGSFFSTRKECTRCEFNASCEFYKRTQKTIDSRKSQISYEAAQGIVELTVYNDHSEKDDKNSIIYLLSRLLRYLLDLDDYSLGILIEVIHPSDPDEQPTIKSLAKKHRCSRQAMHRKIVDLVAQHPELATMFRTVLCRLSSARWYFHLSQKER